MRTRVLFVGGLLLALLAATLTGAAAARTKGSEAQASPTAIDLATYPAKRWIVMLDKKPLARYGRAKRGLSLSGGNPAKLNLAAAVNRTYLRGLARNQSAFKTRLARVVKGFRVERSYTLTLNGLAVRMTAAQASKVRRMKGVRAVVPDVPYKPSMYATPAQINAPALWDQLGGQANAGRGIKVAIIDSGVYVTKDAAGNYAGNPCFNDTGYRAPRGYPKGDTRFTNNKVIVARAYFRPTDPPTTGNDTPIPGPGGSSHGTHVGGTVACNANTPAGGELRLSGIAPAAYLMNYRIFYPSNSPDGFENGNGWVVEIVQAIEDAVRDGADVLSNSWGSSHQNTLDWPDPMVEAAESAVDAGVVGVWAQGNSGPATATGNLPSASDKVIAVGAVSKYAAVIQHTAQATAPEPVPANLRNLDTGPAGFGPALTGRVGPAGLVTALSAQTAAVPPAQNNLGCSLAGDVSPFNPGSMTGKIALIERGVCNFSDKVFNAQRAGAIGAMVYNNAANGETLITMGAGVHAADVTIPSVLLRNSSGVAMFNFITANPTTAQGEFFFNPHPAATIGDVIAGFSSRGPTQDKDIKPDVVAPGQDVMSGGYANAPFPGVYTGFGSVSGTSMATPHVAGAAALLLQKHPWWTPAMVKSALMSTANEDVWTTAARTARVSVLAQGAGRIDLAQAPDPGLVFDKPSLSGRHMSPGETKTFKVRAWNISGSTDTWDITTTETGTATASFNITAGTAALTLKRYRFGTIPVTIESVAGAPAGNYEGSVVLVSRATGKRLHIPVWFRVLPAVDKDVLLIDDDGSAFSAALPDRRATYTAMLDSLGLSYDVFGFTGAFPSAVSLHRYRSIVVFTGDNASFGTSGFFAADHDALAEYLDSGGRLWAIGQNWALTEDSGSFSSRLDRGRITSGYLGLAYESNSAFATAPPNTAQGCGPFGGMTLGLSQSSIDLYSPSPNTDTYNAPHTMTPLFRASCGAPGTSAISFGRSSEPSLEEERKEYLYRSLSMGFGIEGVASGATAAQLGDRAMDWLLDEVTVDLAARVGHGKRVTFTATPGSSVNASFTKFRWDFGDGSRIVTTTGPTVMHKYRRSRSYEVRVEATDSLGHTAVTSLDLKLKHGGDDDDDDD